jgi:acetylornithine deacetylase/succinyl-diaminopimelate desuccinylase-like protein
MIIDELHEQIDKDWSKHLSETRKLLRIPSVSQSGEGIQECADKVERMVADLGAKHGQFRASKGSHPLVHGFLDVGADRTGLLYGMYDVQPVGNLDEWDYPPFGATIVTKKPYGEVIINRGSYNSKGALAGMLLALRTMVDHEAVPMNFHFLIEGEEEMGGQSLPRWVYKNKKTLSKADAAFSFDYAENGNGVPGIALGLKGCVYFDLIAEGASRGGPTAEVHSSDAVWVESPVWRLVHAISTMVDENQEPVVDGLWENVKGPNEEDLMLIRKLAKRFDVNAYHKEIGIKKFKVEGSKEELLTKYLFEPSINIDGLSAGFEEEGTKTVLPPRAKAKIDIRIVPDMTIAETRKKVMDHLKKRGFTDIKMRNYEDYPWSKIPFQEPVSQACIEAMRYHGKDPEIWPMVAGSAPMYLFDQVLGVPWGSMGLGHGGKAHSPNEFAVVKGMRDLEKSVATVFWKFKEIADNGGPKKK